MWEERPDHLLGHLVSLPLDFTGTLRGTEREWPLQGVAQRLGTW